MGMGDSAGSSLSYRHSARSGTLYKWNAKQDGKTI